jgi:hypothetical protein
VSWPRAALGNLKTAFAGTYHEFGSAGYAVRYFAGRELCIGDITPLPEAERIAMTRLLGDALRRNANADEMIAAARNATLLLAGAPRAATVTRVSTRSSRSSARTSTRPSRSTKPPRRRHCHRGGSAISSSRRLGRVFGPTCSGCD